MAKEVLSEEFAGALVADFYAAYNFYDGIKQRCWVHLERDLESLVEKNPDLPEVALWVDSVMALYHRAKESTKRESTRNLNAAGLRLALNVSFWHFAVLMCE